MRGREEDADACELAAAGADRGPEQARSPARLDRADVSSASRSADKRQTELVCVFPHRILNFPKDLHPMTQFSMAILACQKESQFAQRYQVRPLFSLSKPRDFEVIPPAPREELHHFPKRF